MHRGQRKLKVCATARGGLDGNPVLEAQAAVQVDAQVRQVLRDTLHEEQPTFPQRTDGGVGARDPLSGVVGPGRQDDEIQGALRRLGQR